MSTSDQATSEFVPFNRPIRVESEFKSFSSARRESEFIPLKSKLAPERRAQENGDPRQQPDHPSPKSEEVGGANSENALQLQLQLMTAKSELADLQKELADMKIAHLHNIDQTSKSIYSDLSVKILENIESAFLQSEHRIYNLLSDLLLPFLENIVTGKILSEFSSQISKRILSPNVMSINIFGPPELISALSKTSNHVESLKLCPDEDRLELVAMIDDCQISTCFEDWKALFDGNQS